MVHSDNTSCPYVQMWVGGSIYSAQNNQLVIGQFLSNTPKWPSKTAYASRIVASQNCSWSDKMSEHLKSLVLCSAVITVYGIYMYIPAWLKHHPFVYAVASSLNFVHHCEYWVSFTNFHRCVCITSCTSTYVHVRALVHSVRIVASADWYNNCFFYQVSIFYLFIPIPLVV